MLNEARRLQASPTDAGSKLVVWDLLAREERGPRFRGVSKVWSEEFGTPGRASLDPR